MSRTVSLPEYLSRFKCIGAECEDTCCRGWSMQVDSRTRERYAACGLAEALTDEAGTRVMKRDPATGCCVKFANGLCGIQLEHGEQYLGDACYFYPRVTRALGDAVTMTASLSCPEIVRLALFGDNPFEQGSGQTERLPENIRNYLPEGLTPEQARAIHHAFLRAALREGETPERSLMRIFAAAEALDQMIAREWPVEAAACLENAEARLSRAEASDPDSVYLLQALCGLAVAAKYLHRPRLMQTIQEMEAALQVKIRRDTLAIVSMPDSAVAANALNARWRSEWQGHFCGLLKRYVAMQVSLGPFPFGGFGRTLPQRAAVMGIRLATVRLGLMSLCHAANGSTHQTDVVRVIQSISGFLDHLADANFSLKVYAEAGWLNGGRLRGLLEAS